MLKRIRWGWVAVVVLGAWSLPPMIQTVLHRCPVRPNGINEASAVPAFARKYGVSCSQCHSAFPTLNAYGRQFKLNGYVRSKGSNEGILESTDGGLWTDKIFPWGVVVRSRPYDKLSSDSEFSMQAIRDVDLFIASGDASKNVSFFGEIDANADTSPSFSPSLGDLQLGYHPYRYANLLLGRRGFFVMDPYQTLSNFGSPTIANRGIAGGQPDQGSLSLDTMDQTKQTIAAYGQLSQAGLGSVYYAAGASADKGDDAGKGPKDGNIRLALSTPKDNFMIGTFGSVGNEGPSSLTGVGPTDKVQFSKTGVDTMAEFGNLIGRSAFLYAFDKNLTTLTREINRAAYVELMYILNKGDSDAPFLVPLVRQNWYQTTGADGSRREFSYFTAQLAHYFRANLKAFVEFSADTKQDIVSTDPDPTVRHPKGNRWTLQAELGF